MNQKLKNKNFKGEKRKKNLIDSDHLGISSLSYPSQFNKLKINNYLRSISNSKISFSKNLEKI
jgi:hypothetical protein